MQTRLTITTLTTIEKPLTTCGVNLLVTTKDGRKTFVPPKEDKAAWSGLRVLTNNGNAAIGSRAIRAKSLSFALMRPDILVLQVRVSKSGGGYGDIARFLYLAVDSSAKHGSVQMRVHDTLMTLIDGPIRLMDSLEAREAIGPQFKSALEFDPTKDCKTLGVILQGVTQNQPMVTRTTIGEDGEPTEVRIKRAPRQIGL